MNDRTGPKIKSQECLHSGDFIGIKKERKHDKPNSNNNNDRWLSN